MAFRRRDHQQQIKAMSEGAPAGQRRALATLNALHSPNIHKQTSKESPISKTSKTKSKTKYDGGKRKSAPLMKADGGDKEVDILTKSYEQVVKLENEDRPEQTKNEKGSNERSTDNESSDDEVFFGAVSESEMIKHAAIKHRRRTQIHNVTVRGPNEFDSLIMNSCPKEEIKGWNLRCLLSQ